MVRMRVLHSTPNRPMLMNNGRCVVPRFPARNLLHSLVQFRLREPATLAFASRGVLLMRNENQNHAFHASWVQFIGPQFSTVTKQIIASGRQNRSFSNAFCVLPTVVFESAFLVLVYVFGDHKSRANFVNGESRMLFRRVGFSVV